MKSLINTLHRSLVKLFGGALALLMLAVFVVVFINAFWRYTAGKSLIWGEEFAVYAMIFGVMLGMGLGYLKEQHVRFTIFLDALPKSLKHWNLVMIDVVVFAIGLGLAYSGYEFLTRRGGITSPGLAMPMWIFQSSTVAGGLSLAVSSAVMFLRRVFNVQELEADA